MARPKATRPTDKELRILNIIWAGGPMITSQIHGALKANGDQSGYNSTLKICQIMVAKGLLAENRTVRPLIYSATKSRTRVQKELLRDLCARAFDNDMDDMIDLASNIG